MDCKIELKDLVEVYAQLQNLTDGLTPSFLQKVLTNKDESKMFELKRIMITQQIVNMMDVALLKKTNLRVGASPFVADAEEILLSLDNGD